MINFNLTDCVAAVSQAYSIGFDFARTIAPLSGAISSLLLLSLAHRNSVLSSTI